MSGLFRRNKRPRAAAAESRTQDPALTAPAEAQISADGQSGANPKSGAPVQPGVNPQSGAGRRPDADADSAAAKRSTGSLWTTGRKVDSPGQPQPSPPQPQ